MLKPCRYNSLSGYLFVTRYTVQCPLLVSSEELEEAMAGLQMLANAYGEDRHSLSRGFGNRETGVFVTVEMRLGLMRNLVFRDR